MFLIFSGLSAAQFHSYLFESKGIRGLQIGILLMTGQGAAILSPLLQVFIIRKFDGTRVPLLLMILGAAIALALLPHMQSFHAFLILFPVFSFCAAAIFPLNAAYTFEAMRDLGHDVFFRIRSLGTLGFLVGCLVSVFFSSLTDLPLLYKGFSAALLMALAIVFQNYRKLGTGLPTVLPLQSISPSAPSFMQALRLLNRPTTLRLLLVLGLMNFANALATGVQGNYLFHRWHGGQATISLAWVVSTACEVPLMLMCARILTKYGLRPVLALGVFGTLIKLVGLAAAGTLWQFYLALTMHGWFFSGALTGFSIYLDRNYSREDRASLQTLSGVFYAGIPSALAGLTAGWVWQVFSLRAVYLLSGMIAVPVALYAFLLLRPSRQSQDEFVF